MKFETLEHDSFQERFVITKGYSATTLPRFILSMRAAGRRCDLVLIDGDHGFVEWARVVVDERARAAEAALAVANAEAAEEQRMREQIAADEDDAVAPETHPEIAAAIAAIGEEKKRRARE